jgi:hypothetical protein
VIIGEVATSITADAQFAPDSSLEGAGFELSVPRRLDDAFEHA